MSMTEGLGASAPTHVLSVYLSDQVHASDTRVRVEPDIEYKPRILPCNSVLL